MYKYTADYVIDRRVRGGGGGITKKLSNPEYIFKLILKAQSITETISF